MNIQKTPCRDAHASSVLPIAPDTYIVSISGVHMDFEPGQHIRVGRQGEDLREYSIYSAPHDAAIEILIREVPGGSVSHDLCTIAPGSPLTIEGPLGTFVTPENRHEQHFLLIANGTGIAPFRSMLRTHPNLKATVLHGVRMRTDINRDPVFCNDTYTACVSREPGGPWHGRVTDYLRKHPPTAGTQCYLCGSCDMIYDVFAILQEQGIPREDVHVETYY